MNAATKVPTYDAESDVAAWVVGSGIFLIQLCAVVVGLLPSLLLLLPFVLPLVLLGVVAGVLVGLPLAVWRLGAWVVRRVIALARPTYPGTPT